MTLGRPARIRLILADDHVIVAEGLRRMLDPEFEVLATVGDGRALIEAARRLKPDIVVADISMPLLNGIDAIRQLRREQPQTRAVCLTMHMDRTYVAEAFEAGASGYVVKHAASDELREALQAVARGGHFVSAVVGGRGSIRRRDSEQSAAPTGARLTARQREILQLIAEGETAKQIARRLGVSPKTVEFHKYRILRNLGLQHTTQLVQYAIQHGLIAS